jgi:hypothetical protein
MTINIQAAARLIEAHRVLAYPYQAESYVNTLLVEGYKIVGEGYHGVALSVPNSPEILKIGPTAVEESMSYVWLQWAIKNQSPWVPKISSLKNSRKGFYICQMERLQHASRSQIQHMLDTTGLSEVLVPSIKVPDRWDLKSATALSDVSDKTLRKTMSYIIKIAGSWKGRHLLDVTEENLMHRGSQIVFVDPLA